MSFGRNISLGKPDLPIHHLHVYFPVQLVHKLVERMTDLKFKDITPEEGKKYKHNSESETNSPYIVVSTFEGACPSNTFAGLPETPKLAGAYEYGLLDGNLGQMVSFQSTYKSTLRIEVPVWPEVLQAVLPKNKANAHLGRSGIAPSAPLLEITVREQPPAQMHRTIRPLSPPVSRQLMRRQRKRRMTRMCLRKGKDASPSGKASCSEPRTPMLHDALEISTKSSPSGS